MFRLLLNWTLNLFSKADEWAECLPETKPTTNIKLNKFSYVYPFKTSAFYYEFVTYPSCFC